jgi:hypothetical protein
LGETNTQVGERLFQGVKVLFLFGLRVQLSIGSRFKELDRKGRGIATPTAMTDEAQRFITASRQRCSAVSRAVYDVLLLFQPPLERMEDRGIHATASYAGVR